ncbi:MAG: Crp/Fnr family transcriptional regulator [Bacteroidetes bacterium]|jgi:CRP-like cAMP-binding protein|nr:Crp/Fnr family transcriptional regulator [Bacteroidota bacterium]
MDNLKDILNFDSNAKPTSFKKGTIIQRAGEITSLAYYVKKGLLRSYTIDDKGKEHVFMFASEGWIIADLESQEFNRPTELFIDCIENSEILIFDRKSVVNLNLSNEQLLDYNRLLTRRIAVLQKRVIMLMSASAQNRYNFFLEMYPDIPNRVPQRMIASYLGITPQALSTIRAKIVKKYSS